MEKTSNKKPARKLHRSRSSLLDSTGDESMLKSSNLRGFFNLTYLVLFFWLITSNVLSYIESGSLEGKSMLLLMLSRADLVPAWFLLCSYSFGAFFLQKLMVFGLPTFIGLFIHHVMQFLLFGLSIWWLFTCNWPIVQTLFFEAQMFCIWMKMHSYIYTNRDLALQSISKSSPSSSPGSSPSTKKKSSPFNEKEKQKDSSKLKKRKNNKNEENGKSRINKEDEIVKQEEKGTNNKTAEEKIIEKEAKELKKEEEREQKEVKELREELKYPNNVNLSNFFYFLCAPTLVYELEYPRTDKIRWGYLMEKIFSFVGFFLMLNMVVSNLMLPILVQTKNSNVFICIAKLIVPFTLAYLLIFYLVFDIICNAIAEITRFGDRQFYGDWWNSTSWDYFAREWNKPVHKWLLKHVYLELRDQYKADSYLALFTTFLFSSILHELFMTVIFKVFRPYLFFCQMSQLWLIWINNVLQLKGTTYGNFLFWIGLSLGPPLLGVLYSRSYVMNGSW